MGKKGPKPRDLSGKTFGRLTVIRTSHTDGVSIWERCQCECGRRLLVRRKNLMGTPGTRSCGCSHLGSTRRRTHGMRHTPEYQSWSGMKGRCLNEKNPKYANYGGRGITVCERWLNSFANFVADMGKKPSAAHTLDRIDNNGDYEPGNCRWATPLMQAANRRPLRKSRTGRVLRH